MFQNGINPFLNYLDTWETNNNLDKIKSAFDLNHNMSENYDYCLLYTSDAADE